MTVTIEIKVRNPAAYTLNTVVSSPRTCTPTDIKIASSNVEIVSQGDRVPALLLEYVDFILKDFFILAHRSGLYNRQKPLWESIARVNKVSVNRVSQGIFKKLELPVFDLVLEDSLGAPQIYACILEEDAIWKEDKKTQESLRDFLRRVEQSQKKQASLRGLFYCAPASFPASVLKKTLEMTGSQDPLARYESLLPPPLILPINLVEHRHGDGAPPYQSDPLFHESEEESASSPEGEIVDCIEDGASIISSALEVAHEPNQFTFELVHPDLRRKK